MERSARACPIGTDGRGDSVSHDRIKAARTLTERSGQNRPDMAGLGTLHLAQGFGPRKMYPKADVPLQCAV